VRAAADAALSRHRTRARRTDRARRSATRGGRAVRSGVGGMSAAPIPNAGLDARVAAALVAVRSRAGAHAPRVALTLGSGLGGVVHLLEDATRIPTSEIPH